MNILSKLKCAVKGHSFSSYQLFTAHYRGGITKDATQRKCKCCGKREVYIIPFKQFTFAK